MFSGAKGAVLFPQKARAGLQSHHPGGDQLPATLLNEPRCGVNRVSEFPGNPDNYDMQNLPAIFVFSEIRRGSQRSPVVGRILSELILDRRSSLSIEAFRADRFASGSDRIEQALS